MVESTWPHFSHDEIPSILAFSVEKGKPGRVELAGPVFGRGPLSYASHVRDWGDLPSLSGESVRRHRDFFAEMYVQAVESPVAITILTGEKKVL
jgi:hypothetical protein